MKKLFLILCISLGILSVSGCNKVEQVEHIEISQLVKTIQVSPQLISGERSFPAVVRAHKRADLSFRVAGKVQHINFKEGVSVKKGQIIAQLDKSDYQIALNDRKANFQRAAADFKRAEELIKQNYISKTEYEKLKSQYASEDAALKQAQLNLEYTDIIAPFDGTLSRRYIEQYEDVQATQTVFNFADTSTLELIVDMPENLVQQYNYGNSEVSSQAYFSTSADKAFDITFKEFSTKADAQTQTFRTIFELQQPENLLLLQGMTATVVVTVELISDQSTAYIVPLSAITATADMSSQVWKVDPKTMRVASFPVTIGRIAANNIEVLTGISSGDRLITAGNNYLREGQLVHFMENVEQADPSTAP